jgi:hypothetical protein
MKYIDLIGYPIALALVYIPISMIHWSTDPFTWTQPMRFIWVVWGLIWGFMLGQRIKKD